jgi:hypothetical protein
VRSSANPEDAGFKVSLTRPIINFHFLESNFENFNFNQIFIKMNNELETLKLGIMSLIMNIPLTNDQAKFIKLDDFELEQSEFLGRPTRTTVIYEKERDSESTASKSLCS